MQRIMVVQGSPARLEESRQVLATAGFRVTALGDGREALARIDQDPHDLVIAEIVLPGMTGCDLCRGIKSIPSNTARVILVGTADEPSDLLRGLESGADDFLCAPWEAHALIERIHANLNGSRSRALALTRVEKEAVLAALLALTAAQARERSQSSGRSLEEESARHQLGLLQSTLDALAARVAILDETGRILAVSGSWRNCEEPGHLFGREWAPGIDYAQACIAYTGPSEPTAKLLVPVLREILSGERAHWLYEYLRGGPFDSTWQEVVLTRCLGGGRVRVVVAHEDVTRRKRIEELLRVRFSVGRILVESVDPSAAYQGFLRELCVSLGLDLGEIWMPGSSGDRLLRRCAWHPDDPDLAGFVARTQSTGFRRGEGLPGQAWALGRPLYAAEVAHDKVFLRAQEAARIGLHGAVAQPILAEGQPPAVLMLFSRNDWRPQPGTETLLEEIGILLGQFIRRERAETALRDHQEQLRLILDSTGEAIYGIDLQGRCTFCNPACLRLLGYADPSELHGRNMHALIHSKRADGSPYPVEECPIYRAFREKRGSHSCDEVLWRKDGSAVPVECWSHPILSNGECLGAVVTFVDISERRRLEEQFRQAQKMEAVGRLAGGIAHDFNNVLSVINGFGDLALDPNCSPSSRLHCLQQIRNAGDRAAGLTRQLLAFSRQQIAAPRLLDANSVLRDIGEMLRMSIGEDVRLEIRLGVALAPIRMDPSHLEQVLMNLAVNARDAMPRGGTLVIESAGVDLCAADCGADPGVTPGRYWRLGVSDTGVGMDPETRERIFDPFFTTKPKGKGTGLGLATVYGIVRQNGGRISVASEPGRGTTFRIDLPMQAGVPEPPQEGPRSVPAGGGETILLTEDDESVRLLLTEVLTHLGHRVLVAPGPEDALRMARAEAGPIQLLLTDVVMPGMTGLELAGAVRKIRPGIKVLFASGYTADAQALREVIEDGAPLLEKPFSVDVLARRVREALAAGGTEPGDTRPPVSGR